jgi:hypothetical protein
MLRGRFDRLKVGVPSHDRTVRNTAPASAEKS